MLIFERLRSYGLQLKSTKCHLFQSSVPFLGHVVGRDGLQCDPRKIEDVKGWRVPDCLKNVRQFLGFVGYYRRFIPNFADLAEPLVALTGKDVPFVWRPACEVSFAELRDAMSQAPILAFPTESGYYVLDTDASNVGLGGVLSQIQNGVECFIAYCSRALRPSQRKYCTTKREMLAVVSMCIQFRSYLRGAKFTLRTDHKSLVWLHRFKDTEGMNDLTATYQRIAAERRSTTSGRPSATRCDRKWQLSKRSSIHSWTKRPAILRVWYRMELLDSPRLWFHHAGRPQMTRQWSPRWWRRHAGRLQVTTARWR